MTAKTKLGSGDCHSSDNPTHRCQMGQRVDFERGTWEYVCRYCGKTSPGGKV